MIVMIIDAHSHIFPSKIALKASKSIGDFYEKSMYSPAEATLLVEEAKKAGIDRVLVCSSAVTPNQVESINNFIASECEKHPMFFGLAAMHPDLENIPEELDRAVSLGLHGVKFHPDFQKFNIDDPRAIPMYKEIAKRNLPILFHTGDDRYDYSSLDRVFHLLDQIPELKVIGAHFGGYTQWEKTVTMERRENLWFDTSSSLAFIDKEMALRLIDHFGADRFFFGTDFPMWSPEKEMGRFLNLGLSEEEKELIFHKNFENLFGKLEIVEK
ncbi:MAG: amidohydrolase [Clostridia bacterium]|nr:amidohydrolase [Clostridia bacterium]